MPLVQGSALWSMQRVFSHPRSSRSSQSTEDTPASPPQSTSFWKTSCTTNLFHRRSSTAHCPLPKRSVSTPLDFTLKLPPEKSTTAAGKNAASSENIISKSISAPNAFSLKPICAQTSSSSCTSPRKTNVSSNISPPQTCSPSNPAQLELPATKMSTLKTPVSPCTDQLKPLPSLSAETVAPNTLSSETPSASLPTDNISAVTHTTFSSNPEYTSSKSPVSQSAQCRASPSSSPLKSSPGHSPLKSPSHHSPSRRHLPHSQQFPVAPGPPWSELLEARRRLLAVEGRRQALCALEMRVQQIHYVFLQAELRVARQREGLTRLVEAAGRAEVQATVHGQRIRKALRRQKPRLLACALCVPWPSKSERRGGQHPRHSRCALFQGRIQVLRGCVGSEELGARD
ncbi:TMF-regulated nuclear protein 1 [Pelodytes ibericus]